MSFTIAMTDRLAAKFQELYADQGDNFHLFNKPALIFQWGMGEALYFLADGRLLIDTSLTFDAPHIPIDIADDYWAALVIIAYWLDEPPLLDLLPARPADIPSCWLCEGNHWSIFKNRGSTPSRIICPNCGGLGWKHPRVPKPPSES